LKKGTIMKKTIAITTLAMAALLVSGLAFAAEPAPETDEPSGPPEASPETLFELTPAQQMGIKKLYDKYVVEFQDAQSNIRDMDEAIRGELQKEKPSDAKLKSLRNQRLKYFNKFQELRGRMHEELKRVLDQDQESQVSPKERKNPWAHCPMGVCNGACFMTGGGGGIGVFSSGAFGC
jgi:Spy/CpxP family protein refolding chaperone